MSAFWIERHAIAWTAALAVSMAAPNAAAQAMPDAADTVYATGAIPETEEELAGRPRTPLHRAFLPEAVDLRDRFPPAGRQGEQGSCVGWAVGYAARSYYNSGPRGGPRLTADRIPSPAYIYDAIRAPGAACDAGSRIADAMILLKRGAVAYSAYPYDERLCRRPGADTVARASAFRIADWRVVEAKRLDQVKAELAGGHPVVVGMRPNRDFHRLRGERVWRAGMPEDGNGHHAVTVVGYSERGQHFTVMNSWGRGWGENGFGRIGYDTFRTRVKYGFSMRLETEPVPPPPKPAPPSPVRRDLDLPAVGCGRLRIAQENGKAIVKGFVGSKDDLARVRKAADRAQAGFAVDLRPWPQCETLMTLEKPLGHAGRPSIRLPKRSYRAGETLSFQVRMAPFQGYLHVAYLQADGNVVNLVGSGAPALATLAANTTLTFGDGLEGRTRFTVSAPFGSEMIVAIASGSPLFSEDRPPVETEREFLTALRKALIARPDPNQPERVVSAGFVALETAPGG